jgi:hypothetical protein
VYRRTDYLVLRNGGEAAVVAVRKASTEPLFSPVVEARVLAGPDEVVSVSSPETDVGNATALARAALRHARPGARAYVVQGRYEHVNFIWEPAPVRIGVTEVVPPEPPKLFAMAEQVVAFDEDLPPIDLVLKPVAAVYDINVIDARPEVTVAEQDAKYGTDLFAQDPDRCCAMRKVAPLGRALAPYDAWVTGLRRDQSPSRANTKVISWDAAKGKVKTCPIAAEDARAGRWAGFAKTECGIH